MTGPLSYHEVTPADDGWWLVFRVADTPRGRLRLQVSLAMTRRMALRVAYRL